MNPTLTAVVASEHQADLRRAGRDAGRRIRASERARRSVERVDERAGEHAIVLRLAEADDSASVRTLAELDESREPTGNVLLALIDGQAVAALSLDDGHVVSNPFVATSASIALLRLRGRHLAGPARRRPRARLRPRFA